MLNFHLQRVIRSKPLYIVLFFGILISLWHVKEEILPLEYDPRYGVAFTPYTKWFEFAVISGLSSLFFLLLPILAALPFADTFLKDKQTGFLLAVLSRGKINSYFTNLFAINFFVAGIVIAIPLLLNLYLAFMFLPNIPPDPIVNNQMSLDSMMTYFPELYYSHPLLHTLFYIFLAFMYAGLFASVCLSVSFYINNRFMVILFAFIIQMVLTLFFQLIGKYGWIHTRFLLQVGDGSSFQAMLWMFIIGMFLSLVLYIVGVKKLVIQ